MSKSFVYFFDYYWRMTHTSAPYFEMGNTQNSQKSCTLHFLNYKVDGFGYSKDEAKNNAAKNLLHQLPERFQQLYMGYKKLVQDVSHATNKANQTRPVTEEPTSQPELDGDEVKGYAIHCEETNLHDGLKDLFKDDILEAKKAKTTKKKTKKKKYVKSKEKCNTECFENDSKTTELDVCIEQPPKQEQELLVQPESEEPPLIESKVQTDQGKIREFFAEVGLKTPTYIVDKFNGLMEKSELPNESEINNEPPSTFFGETLMIDQYYENETELECDLDEGIYEEDQGYNGIFDTYEEYAEEFTAFSEHTVTSEESLLEFAMQSICRGPFEELQQFVEKQAQLTAKWSNAELKYDLPQLRVIQYVMKPDHNCSKLVQLCLQYKSPLPTYKESCAYNIHGRRYQVTVSVESVVKTMHSKSIDNAYKQAALLLYDALLKNLRNPLIKLYEMCAGDSNGMPVISVTKQGKKFQATCRVGNMKRIGFSDDEETSKKIAADAMFSYLTKIAESKLTVLEETSEETTQNDNLKFEHYRRLTATDGSAKHIDFSFRHLFLHRTDDSRKLQLKRLLELDIQSAKTRVLTFLHILNINLKETPRVDRKGEDQVLIEFIGCELDTVFVGPKHKIYEQIMKFLIEMTF